MLRDAHIPLLLWLPAAVMFHFVSGYSAFEGAQTLEGFSQMLAFSRMAREEVRPREMTIEVLDEGPPSKSQDPKASEPEEEPEKPVVPEAPKPEVKAARPLRPKAPEKKPFPQPLPQATPPKPLVPLKPAEKKDAPKPVAKKEAPKKEPEKDKQAEKKDKPQQIELPKPDGRIAVINDPSLEKDQQDNPNAKRIAEHANTVKDESMARFRSYDQNTSKPTGGGRPEDSDPNLTDPGNSSEQAPGHSVENDDPGPVRPGSENGPQKAPDESIARSPSGNDRPQVGQAGRAAQKADEAREEGKGESQGAAVSGNQGSWSISPDGGDGRKKQAGRKGRKAIGGRKHIPGVPMPGMLPPAYSINAYGLQEALGVAHLRKEQEKARSTRIARHRGRFKANSFQKYRAAIENYDPSVKPGNQTSLNAARVPFAAYINKMHNRIHPIFADGFLASLSRLPGDDKLSDMKLLTHMEVVLDGATGRVVAAGIVKASGVTAFDVAALSSIHSAAPYGQAPEMIVSPDGKVYVHWEFYRDPYYACTSKFARPYLIKGGGKKDGEEPTPPSSPPSQTSEARHYGGGPLRPSRKQ
jgi:hypothetical protein